jgi:hypothetical protein
MGRLSLIKEAIRQRLSRSRTSGHEERPWWDFEVSVPPGLEGHVVEYVVTNRVFLLGLDELYRSAMKESERGELLACAQSVAAALRVGPADVPVEGYYTEGADLTAYFRLVRALQDVPLERAPEVESLPQFHRLLAVTSSPIYGRPIRENLLPTGRDPLSAALKAARCQEEWTVSLLTAAAARLARETDDCSLVGLASRAEDPVVLAAVRESVVLYAEAITLGGIIWPKFVWQVDPELRAAAQRFVDTFNALFGQALPPAAAQYAHVFGSAGSESQIAGRCVRLGQTDEPQRRYYHWAVVKGVEGQLAVNDFWAPEIWTTERYRRGRAVRDVAQDGRRLPYRSM